jgi:hypothetical protein
MKSNRWFGLAALAVLMVGMLTVWGAKSPGQAPAGRPQTWEYSTMYVGNGDYTEQLNKWGSQGWELVAAYNADPQKPAVYVFKRAKQ